MKRALCVLVLMGALGAAGAAGPFLGVELEPVGPSLVAGWDTGPVLFWVGKPVDQLTSWVGDYTFSLALVGEVAPALDVGVGGLLDFNMFGPALVLQEAGPYISLYAAPIEWLTSYFQAGFCYSFEDDAWDWRLSLGGWLDFAGLLPDEASGGE